ncbi:hypothetical protein VNI00_003523 [Paramarasmius palmivorus]|uniref:Uncharacterized protein n=1 Tax=Paramarasmius palmivorus TaxID=297713 RepID=A0AAW0DSV3_9AGAR
MEVEYVWFGDKGIRPCTHCFAHFVSDFYLLEVVYLFFINRYLTPLGFIVNLLAYTSPIFAGEDYLITHNNRCDKFIKYEGAMTMIGIDIAGLMMLTRIYALYVKQKWIVLVVASLLALHFATNTWLLIYGIPAVPRYTYLAEWGVHSCSMIFSPHSVSRVWASSTAWLPLVYDSAVFGLTFYKTYPKLRTMSTSRVMKQLLVDGLVYYGVILAVTLALSIMIATAPDGLKNVAAQLELLLTVTMMSRITLNLKRCARRDDPVVNIPLARVSTNKTRPSNDMEPPAPIYRGAANYYRPHL